VRRRKILFLGLLTLLPALLPVVVAALRGPFSRGAWGLELYAAIAEYGFLGTLVPLGAILLGTALMGDDLETGTATYLMTRPTPRSALILGKFAAYAVVMAGIFLPALVLTFMSVVLTSPRGTELGPGLALLGRTSGVVCLAIVAYGALCGLLGTLTQRPVIFASVFVFGWEPLTRIVPGYVDFLTLKKHLLALWPTIVMSDRKDSVEISRKVIEVGVGEALLVLAVVVATLAALTTLTLRQREFVRGQTLG
jgi:ABC-type transport system involved in multi-copper enzyme maturation permease subunit